MSLETEGRVPADGHDVGRDRPVWGHWLGSSLSSEPQGLAGLSVTSHAGVLTRGLRSARASYTG